MKPLRTFVTLAAALMLGHVLPSHAGALRSDLIGTWTGTIKCKAFHGGAKDKFTQTGTLKISQSGLDVGILLEDNTGATSYTGVLNPDAKKPFEKAELAIVYCNTNDRVGDGIDFDELGRMATKVKQGQSKGSFKGTSIFASPGILSQTQAGTCKWSFKRTSPNAPNVPTTCLFD